MILDVVKVGPPGLDEFVEGTPVVEVPPERYSPPRVLRVRPATPDDPPELIVGWVVKFPAEPGKVLIYRGK